jgi:hypothetical protein
MRRLSSLFGRPEFHLVLFFVALLAFGRPVLFMLNTEHPSTVMLSFFVPWVLVVGSLLCASRTYRAPDREEKKIGPGEQD